VLEQTVRADLADLKVRSEAASKGTEDEQSCEPDDLETIQILDSISFPTSLSTAHKSLFHKRRRRRSLSTELPLLFAWSTCPDRAGAHRRYAVGALIALEKAEMREGRVDVEKAFIEWVDRGGGGDDGGEGRMLLEELIRVGVVSYSLYLQRMIARGETEERADGKVRLLEAIVVFGITEWV
jgi:mediator of RNA polymerase II transcription subunit 12